MDWPRTIRLVYASVSISSVCAIMLQVIVIRTRWNTKRPTKEFSKQKSRARHVTRTCPCMTTSIIIKITRDQHVNTFTLIGSQLVVMVLRAQWPLSLHLSQNMGMLCMQELFFLGWVDYLQHCKWSTFLQKERLLTRERMKMSNYLTHRHFVVDYVCCANKCNQK